MEGSVTLAEKNMVIIKSILTEEKNFCLHFDGKRLEKIEYQVVCLKSSTREIRLGIARCKSGSSQDIYEALFKIIDEYDAWSSITMIICDTTAVNTGHNNGVVVRIQRKMASKNIGIPQYIGCQHHILDNFEACIGILPIKNNNKAHSRLQIH